MREMGGVPDWVAVSVGDGCTIAGIWKGLKQMHELGVIDRLPRLIAAQAAEVAPLDMRWSTTGYRRPAMARRLPTVSMCMCRAIGGKRSMQSARRMANLSLPAMMRFWMQCEWPGGTECSPSRLPLHRLAAVVAAIDSKIIGPNERVLVMVTGSGLKDTKNAIRAGGKPIPVEPTSLPLKRL